MPRGKFGQMSEVLRAYRSQRVSFLGWSGAILFTLLLIALGRAYCFQTFKIPSGSMMPTLLIGDHIIVNKFIYGVTLPGLDHRIWAVRSPKRGDVVVFYRFSEFEDIDLNTHYIKRIVAEPGDTVEVQNYQVIVNGVAVSYRGESTFPIAEEASDSAHEAYGPIKLNPGQYFVMVRKSASFSCSIF